EAYGVFLQLAHQQTAKPNMVFSLTALLQPHRPSSQRSGNENQPAPPTNTAPLSHLARLHPFIFQILRCSLVLAVGLFIHLCRTFHPQRLVGPLLVKSFSPLIKASLLLRHAAPSQLSLHVQMQALMPAVVLGTTRPPSLQINA